MGQLYSRPSDNFIHINLDVRLCKRDYHAVIKLQPKLYINQCTHPQHAYKVCNKTQLLILILAIYNPLQTAT